jgi:hypothetical protein
MTYIQNPNHFRDNKLTFADWFKFRVIEELTTYKQCLIVTKFLTNDAECLIFKPRLLGLIFGWVIVISQLNFHMYYLFVVESTPCDNLRSHYKESCIGITQAFYVVCSLGD